MRRYAKLILITLVLGAAISPSPVSAGVFQDMVRMFTHSTESRGALFNTGADMSNTEAAEVQQIHAAGVLEDVKRLNTIANIEKLSEEMERYGITAILVDVEDANERFYVVKDRGIVERYDKPVDARVRMTKEDMDFVLTRVNDGDVGILERIEISNQLRGRVVHSNIELSQFTFCYTGGIL